MAFETNGSAGRRASPPIPESVLPRDIGASNMNGDTIDAPRPPRERSPAAASAFSFNAKDPIQEIKLQMRSLVYRRMIQFVNDFSRHIPNGEGKDQFVAALPQAFDSWAHEEDVTAAAEPQGDD